MWADANSGIGNYVSGKFIAMIIVWVVSYIIFAWLGLPYTMLLSLTVGLSVVVPYIGAAFENLHPIAIITAMLVFGWVWAFWRVFFATPLATLIVAVLKAWPSERQLTTYG